jgi:gluconolactonase
MLALAACAGNGNGGTGGQGGTASGGKGGSTGDGGSTGSGGTGTGGATGAGGSSTGGTTGSGGSASGGTTGTGGTVTGSGGSASGGTTGSGGTTTGTGGSSSGGATGSGGSATGGATGTGGQAGGTGGAAGSGGGFTPYVCPSGITSPSASAIPAGSTATRISGAPPVDNFDGSNGTSFTNVEGPVWIGNALYFSEMTNGPNPPPSRILKIDASDTVTLFYPPSGAGGDSGSNGMAVDAKGNLVTANHGVGGIVSFTVPGATKTTLISSYNGKRFNSPNDLTIRSDGTIYFTDPNFQAPRDSQGQLPQTTTGVYMVPPGSTTATEIISTLSNPNGITLSLDEKTLYVDSGSGVNAYAVNTDGTIVATATIIDPSNLQYQNTDGMAIDCAGDLYVVRVNTKDIDVISFGSTHPSPTSAGTHLTTITGVPGNGQLTNIAFGGSDHKTLYITAQGNAPAKGVFKLAMPVAGMPY